MLMTLVHFNVVFLQYCAHHHCLCHLVVGFIRNIPFILQRWEQTPFRTAALNLEPSRDWNWIFCVYQRPNWLVCPKVTTRLCHSVSGCSVTLNWQIQEWAQNPTPRRGLNASYKISVYIVSVHIAICNTGNEREWTLTSQKSKVNCSITGLVSVS